MAVLLTRLGGKRVALSRIDVGFAEVWAGEFRDDQDRPLGSHLRYGERYEDMVITGPAILDVLCGLQHQLPGRTFRS